ncbi:MAG TPA: ABC transporter permease [Pyrinomonadaceae bacterium]|nr:ABC transporter permease [Pyrinomonadaceae bacterium]
MSTLGQDLRYGARMLMKSPGFTVIAVLALALGIGANSAIFSVVNAVLLRSLPYKDSERLVMLWEQHPQAGRMGVAGLNFIEWQRQATFFEHAAVFAQTSFDLTGQGEAERIQGTRVTADFFKTIGSDAALGRTFRPGEDAGAAEPVVVVSHGFWQKRLGGDARALGTHIKLDETDYTVIGVMPQDFGERLDDWVWTPLSTDPERISAGGRSLQALARLKPGVTLAQAQAELDKIAADLSAARPDFNRDWTFRLVPLHEQITGSVRLILLVLSVTVCLVLLIACANVANLSLARATRREGEMAIRTALGATRWRLVRQLLTESVLLALLGGAAGLLLALWGIDLLLTLGTVPRAKEIGVDSQVLVFTLIVSVATGILFGLAPALRVARRDVNSALKDVAKSSVPGFSRNRLRGALVVAEVALAVVLLIGAGLLMRSFVRLTSIDPGFETDNVLLLEVPLSETRYKEDERVVRFFDEMLARVRALPGVEAAGTTHTAPLDGSDSSRPFIIADRTPPEPGKEPGAGYRVVSPGYFRALGIPVLQGRDFSDNDRLSAPAVVMINQTLARRHWPNANPVGQRMRQGAVGGESPWMEIVGVVGDVRHSRLDAEPRPEMYFPYAQAGGQASRSIVASRRRITLAVRASSSLASLGEAVRREISQIDKNQPVTGVRTMNESVARSVMTQRFSTLLVAIFAGLALALAMIGVYGVMSFSVGGRTREIGIRMALGAQGADVMRMIVGQGMWLVLAGIGVGLAASFAATRLMAGLLYGVSTTDPLVFFIIPTLLAAVALLACYLPARRATKINPMEALRYE